MGKEVKLLAMSPPFKNNNYRIYKFSDSIIGFISMAKKNLLFGKSTIFDFRGGHNPHT